MKRVISVVAALLVTASALAAQSDELRPEIRPWASISIPLDAQRDFFKDAPMFGLQGALEVRPNLHLVGTMGWIPGETRYVVGRTGVNVLDYNVGVEYGTVQPLGGNWELKPFIGIGGGARTYLYESAALDDGTGVAGYGAIGTEFQVGRTALRLEGRSNVFYFNSPLAGEESKTRTDLGIAFGVAYHLR